MKTLFVFLILLSYNVHAQKSIFVRVFNPEGKKINTGRVLMITDTSLQLKGNYEPGGGDSKPVDIPVRNIGFIKTKHSVGNNVLIGSLISISTLAIVGAVTTSSDQGSIIHISAGEGAAAGAIVGLPVGAALGAITALFKKSKTFMINGDMNKLKEFQLVALEKKE